MPSKQEKFAEVESFKNCFKFHFENITQGFELKGKWLSNNFKNNNPIVLELGCGKGEYTIGLAQNNLNKNYIGVDVKGNRIWNGAKIATDTNMQNVSFLRSRIELIDHCFAPNEIDEIWITFPDPQPQKPRARQRLTHPIFLNRYKQFLKPNGLVHLKTDSTSLYEFTLQVIEENKLPLIWHTNNLYQNCPAERKELIEIKTYYETLFTGKGEDIKYILFKLS
jgi:tRNA (guanine-N7-)-methyltransferase